MFQEFMQWKFCQANKAYRGKKKIKAHVVKVFFFFLKMVDICTSNIRREFTCEYSKYMTDKYNLSMYLLHR